MAIHCAEGRTGVVELLAEAELAQRRDLDGCLALLGQVEILLERAPDNHQLARLHTIRAETALAKGDGPQAILAFQAARMTWLAAGRQLEARGAMLGRTAVMLAAGEYDDVIVLVERIRTGLEQGSVRDEDLATRLHLRAHQQLGAAHAATGAMATAMRHFDLADDLARTLCDEHEAASVQLMRGRALRADGLLHRALDVMIDARRALRAVGSEPLATVAVLHIADTLSALGTPVAAIELVEQVRPLVAGQPTRLAQCDLIRAGALLAAGLAEEAMAPAVAARDVFRAFGAISHCAQAELVCARAADQIGRHDLAAESLLAAERLGLDCGDVLTRDRARLLIARNASVRGDLAMTRRIGTRLVEEGTTASAVVEAQTLMTRVTDDLTEAEALIAAASARVDHAGRPELRIELRLARARHLRRSGRIAKALDELRAACDMGERLLRRGATRGQAHGAYAEANDELIDLLLADGSHGSQIEAWQRVRRSKAWSFSAQHAGARGWHVDPSDPGAGDESAADDIDLLIARTRDASAGGTSIPAADLVVPEGPMVEYYVMGEDVLAFVIREGQVHVRRLVGARATSVQVASRWQQECFLTGAAGTTTATAPSLDTGYRELVAPLADLLCDIEDDLLEVAPHRHLMSLPFDAMLDVGGPWRELLVNDAWSGGLLDPLDTDGSGVRPAVLVLAVPDEQAPAIAEEARMIADRLPEAEVHSGEEATADRLADRLAGAHLVHIAAHGRFRAGNPLFSALKLADGWLTAADLLSGRFDLHDRVVVLSACGSGRGSDRMAQPVGLAWACLGAGAAGVVASLWPVDDDATAALMTEFYRGLALGEHPRRALGRARRIVAATHPHPYFWAAFRYFPGS